MPIFVNQVTKLSRDPLFLFALCGAFIFVVFKLLEVNNTSTIMLSAETRTRLIENFESIAGRNVTPEKIAELEQSFIIDELLFREALNAGMHLIDPTTRASLIEIMHNRISASIQQPTEEELVNYYAKHIQRYYTEPLLNFEQHFFRNSPVDGESLLTQLQSGEPIEGDTFPHGSNFPAVSENIIRGIFGEGFLVSLHSLEPTQWRGPIISQYGLHFVRLNNRIAAQPMPFATARNFIANDYMQDQIDQAIAARIAALKIQYEINIEP